MTTEIVTCVTCLAVLLLCAGPITLIVMWLLQDDVATLILGFLSIVIVLVSCRCFMYSFLASKPGRSGGASLRDTRLDSVSSPRPCSLQVSHEW